MTSYETTANVQRFLRRPPAHAHDAAPLEVNDLSVRFNGVTALDRVSFTLPQGTSAAVIGPNGAGKTTLFRVIAGTLTPSSGSVQVYGDQPGGHVCIAHVPQRSRVDWDFPASVSDVVMMGRVRKIGLFRWPTRADWNYVSDAMQRVGVGDLANRQIGELSGGQQQRVFLAQALAQEAELVLMDEPLTGLDVPSQEAIFQILDELKRDGTTVMIATHDLNLAAERFDRVLMLNLRLIVDGPPEEALKPEVLLEGFGGHVQVLPGEDTALMVTDSCCDGEIHDA